MLESRGISTRAVSAQEIQPHFRNYILNVLASGMFFKKRIPYDLENFV